MNPRPTTENRHGLPRLLLGEESQTEKRNPGLTRGVVAYWPGWGSSSRIRRNLWTMDMETLYERAVPGHVREIAQIRRQVRGLPRGHSGDGGCAAGGV